MHLLALLQLLYIFILNLTPGFSRLGKGKYKTKWETFKFLDLVHLTLGVWWYNWKLCHWNSTHYVQASKS